MKWIKYEYICNEDTNVRLVKKIGYSPENLAIAQREAYNGQYEVLEDENSFDKEPIAIELGGTGSKTIEEIKEKFGINESIKYFEGIYIGGGTSGASNKNRIPVPFIPNVMIISRGNGTPYKLTETSVIPFVYDEDSGYYVADTKRVPVGREDFYSYSLDMYYKDGYIEWYTETTDTLRYKADLETGYVNLERYEYSGTSPESRKATNQLNWSKQNYHYLILGKQKGEI